MPKGFLILSGIATAICACNFGCNASSEGGVAGTTNTFKLVKPTLPVTLKQGDKHTITLTVDRGAAFQQTVRVEAQAPKGLHVEFDKSSIRPTDPKEVLMSISADKDALLGDHILKLMATPETGDATTLDVKVTITSPK